MSQHGTLIVEDLHMTYQAADGPVRAVQGVSFTIHSGSSTLCLALRGVGRPRCVVSPALAARAGVLWWVIPWSTPVLSALLSHPIAETLVWCSSPTPSGRT